MSDPLPGETRGPSSARVFTGMGFAVLALAFSSIFITQLERDSVPPLTIAFYRMALATLLLAAPALFLKRGEMVTLARRDLALLVLGGFCLAVHFGAWITSLNYIPISTSVVLVNTHPILVVLASYIFLGERPNRRLMAGTVVGFAGMLIIGHEGFREFDAALAGDGLALLGAVAVVGYFIIGRKMRVRVSLLAYVTPLYAVCALVLLAWSAAAGARLHSYDGSQWIYFLALALVPTILGHTVFNWAIKHVRPSVISVAFLGEPVVASVLAYVFYGQVPSPATLIGGAFVLVGVYFTTSS